MQAWRKFVGLAVFGLCAVFAVRQIDDRLPGAPSRTLSIELDLSGQMKIDGHAGTGLHDEIVALVQTLRTGSATADDHSIEINGVARSQSGWTETLSAFQSNLNPGTSLHVNVEIIDSSIELDALCERMFEIVASNPQIRFEESGNSLNPASFPALDRIIEFARDCRGFAVTITGHSDGSGYEPSNVDLSQRRARAVADYIADAGIERERLLVVGKGSSEPIADNSTRSGRHRNRRIEFALKRLEL